MSNLTILVESLSKQYRIGLRNQRHETLRDHLNHGLKSLLGRNGRHRPAQDTIWSLKDVSFQVREGEVVGIIGRNGSGKSTLLKILSQITEPTSGRALIHGRVGSLLEVGTGFHPELTGRENIYLNGAILGMKKGEIDRKFDEIVAFAETEKFVDTPIKHYSSGMYLRLAFAVAAHLEPEILIVDEVLAVGDARFQKKCLNKMQNVGHEGRTILFVSHNMPAVTRICKRVILLNEGRVVQEGPPDTVVGNYLNSDICTIAAREWTDSRAPGGGIARLRAIRARSTDGQIIQAVEIIQPVRIEMEYEILKPGYVLLPNFQLFNAEGLHILSTHDTDPSWRCLPRREGHYISNVVIPGNLLSDGPIFVGVGLETVDPAIVQFYVPDAIGFRVLENSDQNDRSARGNYRGHIGGVVRPFLEWTTQCCATASDYQCTQECH